MKFMRLTSFLVIALTIVLFTGSSALGKTATDGSYQQIHLPFLANNGQIANQQILFTARTLNGGFSVTDAGELLYSLPAEKTSQGIAGWVIKERFVNALPTQPIPREESAARITFITGGTEAVPVKSYHSVSMNTLYPGIDLVLAARPGNVEKIFHVRPDVDPGLIRIFLEGASSLTRGEDGELLVATAIGNISFSKPVAFQYIDGRKRFVEIAYRTAGNTYGFALGDYDPTLELIIDPLLASSYIGQTEIPEGMKVGTDSAGNVIIAVSGTSAYPSTVGPVYGGGTTDVCLLKFDASLTTLQAATFLGGRADDVVSGMIVKDNSIVVSGYTESDDFPASGSYAGGRDIFIADLSLDLTALNAAIFIGGTQLDQARAMAMDASGNLYLTGVTASSDFPIAGSQMAGKAPKAFVIKINSTLTSLTAAALIGGSLYDEGQAIAVSGEAIYLGGYTESDDFDILNGLYNTFNGGGEDGFVARFDSGLTLQNSTYFGGSGADRVNAILAANGAIYIAGGTGSPDLPVTTSRPYTGGLESDPDIPGFAAAEMFVTKFNTTLDTLDEATYLGGSSNERIYALADDGKGGIVVVGETGSADIFTLNPTAYQPRINNPSDGFIANFDQNLATISAYSYFGGTGQIDLIDAVHPTNDSFYFIGITDSADMATTAGAYETTLQGTSPNIYVARLDADLSEDTIAVIAGTPTSWTFPLLNLGVSQTKQFTITNSGNIPLTISDIAFTGSTPYQFMVTNDTCTVGVNPDQTCTIDVTFAPTSQGSKSATMQITSNASNTNPFGISLTGSCTGDTTSTYTLTIQKDGSRLGYVYNVAQDIDCGPDCGQTYDSNSVVTLKASWDAATTVFAGWTGGGCTGTANCTLTMTANTIVQATFRDVYPTAVSKTRQKECSDPAGTPIDCLNTGQDGAFQAGVLTPKPRFYNNGNGTITDLLTGLMWLADTNCFFGLNGGYWTTAIDTINGFNLNPQNYNCQGYTAAYTNWVMPNINALASLLDQDTISSFSALGSVGFDTSDNPVGFTSYWSSTTKINTDNDSSDAWIINFISGKVDYKDKNESTGFLWPVRTP